MSVAIDADTTEEAKDEFDEAFDVDPVVRAQDTGDSMGHPDC